MSPENFQIYEEEVLKVMKVLVFPWNFSRSVHEKAK